ncbi:MAG: PKD domain-containing protein [Actinomycetota bacterium]
MTPLMPLFRRSRPARGQSIVELALILPIMLVMLATAADLGRLFHTRIVLANAARAGALEAGRHPTSYQANAPCDANTNRILCAIQAESDNSLLTVTPSDVLVTCIPSPCAEVLGNAISVRVEGQFTLLTPFLGAFFGGQVVDLETTATAQIAVQPLTAPAPSGSPTPTPTPTPSPSPTPSPTPIPTGTAGPTPTPTPSPSPTPVCFPPTSDFSFSPSSGKKKKTLFQFTDLSSTTPLCPLTWSWNFGDGAGASSSSTQQNPTHEYQVQGTFTITLVASNAGGSHSRSRTVTVTP